MFFPRSLCPPLDPNTPFLPQDQGHDRNIARGGALLSWAVLNVAHARGEFSAPSRLKVQRPIIFLVNYASSIKKTAHQLISLKVK